MRSTRAPSATSLPAQATPAMPAPTTTTSNCSVVATMCFLGSDSREQGAVPGVAATGGGHRHFRAGNLSGAGLAAQLPHRLGQMTEAVVDTPSRQLAAPGVDRKIAPGRD